MKFTIKKIGHSCVTYERDEKKILIDPGSWTEGFEQERSVGLLLVTHTHADHLDMPRVKILLENNPGCEVWGNQEVIDQLSKEGVEARSIDHETEWNGIRVTPVGKAHAVIYPTLPGLANTGYLIDDAFYHPGDALTVPSTPFKLLALPIIAPWGKLSEMLDFAITCKPTTAFPIHDGMLKHISGGQRQAPMKVLGDAGIEYSVIENGESHEFDI